MVMVVNTLVSVIVLMCMNEFSTTEETDCSSEEYEHYSENGSTERFDESRKRCHPEEQLCDTNPDAHEDDMSHSETRADDGCKPRIA